MSAKTPLSFIEKINAILMRDPKRTAIMAGLGVIMIGLWARMLFNGPSSATASFIRRSVSAITDMGPAQPKPATNNPVLDWLALPKTPIERNLFAIHLDYYAKAGRGAMVGSPEDPAKSPADDADQNREKQILSDNLQTQVAKLKLQTTMMGLTPRAMINGQLVKEGDTVEGFVIVKIEPRKVAVEQDDVTLDVAMP